MTATETDDNDELDAAMAEYLAAVERGRRPDRAAFLAARPRVAAPLAPLLDEIDALHGVGRQLGADAAGAAPVAFGRPARVGEFEVVRVVGRGGMGVVYEAVDVRLNRRVALKVLPADAAFDPAARRRFLHEARVAALLHHPHVVPVLSVGEADGVQYYAMPLIDGTSLDAVLRVLRHRDGVAADEGAADPSSHAGLLATGLAVGFGGADPPPAAAAAGAAVRATPRYLDEVVRLAHDAALALGYAHDAGVVHRDVKPGNLILDVRGRVWLTDFGLAKAAAGTATTTAGRAGTLRYMSPEQAAGRGAEIDARTDVYALGLTLYELLALRPAFAAMSDTELLRQIAAAAPASLRTLNPAVSEDLETVVQKATAKERADRYATAAAFAADLARVRRGLPVAARRLTRGQLARRWARRHRRPLAGAVGAVAAGVGLGLAASTYSLLAAYREAAGQTARLEARESDLMALIDRVNRSELVLKDVPGAQAEQRELVRGAKDVLCRWARSQGASAREKREAVRACLRLVEIEGRWWNHPEALAAARDAFELAAALEAGGAENREDRTALAHSLRHLGGQLREAWNPAGYDQLRHAAELYEALDAEQPGDTAVLNHMALVYGVLAEDRAAAGDLPGALTLVGRGLGVNAALARRYPTGHPMSYSRLVDSHLKLAALFSRTGDPAEAEAHLQAAVTNDAKTAREAKPGQPARLYTFQAPGRYGAFLLAQGRFAEARAELGKCVAVAEPLAAAYPAEREYHEGLRHCRVELARLEYLEGRPEKARELFRLAAAGVVNPPSPGDVQFLASAPFAGVADPATLLVRAEALAAAAPTNLQFKLAPALARLRGGDFLTAETALRDLIGQPSPDRELATTAAFYLAVCLANRGRPAEAAAAFAAADAAGWQPFASNGLVRSARREAEDAIRPHRP